MKLLLKIKTFIIKLFTSVEKFLPVGIDVVNRFKKFIDSPYADMLTAIIPGTIDDAAKIWLRANLQSIIDSFGGIYTIRSLPKQAKNQVYLGIAATINAGLTNDLSKERLTYEQSILATQYKYNETTIV